MDRFVSVVYCDDIRNEVGNKQSLIGIYRDSLLVSDFPVVLPKLCVLINVQTPTSQPFTQLNFRLLKNDELMLEAPIPTEAMAGQVNAIPIPNNQDGFLMCSVALVLSPLQIDGPFKLRVRVDADGEELKGAALRIDKVPSSLEQLPGSN